MVNFAALPHAFIPHDGKAMLRCRISGPSADRGPIKRAARLPASARTAGQPGLDGPPDGRAARRAARARPARTGAAA